MAFFHSDGTEAKRGKEVGRPFLLRRSLPHRVWGRQASERTLREGGILAAPRLRFPPQIYPRRLAKSDVRLSPSGVVRERALGKPLSVTQFSFNLGVLRRTDPLLTWGPTFVDSDLGSTAMWDLNLAIGLGRPTYLISKTAKKKEVVMEGSPFPLEI